MTTPTVTELPLCLEPVTPDAFLEVDAAPTPGVDIVKELDQRVEDGLHITLLWNQTQDRVSVSVFDAKPGNALEFPVQREEAMEAFHHPHAFAATSGRRQRRP